MEILERKCSTCQVIKPIEKFYWKGYKNGKRVRRYECNTCETDRQRDYRKRNPKPKKIRAKKPDTKQWFAEFKKQYSCKDCGISFKEYPWLCDFHHLDPATKDFTVSLLVRDKNRRDKILKEVEKCIPLCANCHRTRHHYERLKKKEVRESSALLAQSNSPSS